MINEGLFCSPSFIHNWMLLFNINVRRRLFHKKIAYFFKSESFTIILLNEFN
jgi:hypothetical protein